MLKILSLTGTNFRSWADLSYTCTPGLTVLLGANGAGKTSIRHAAQFALTGNVTGLRKNDLIRRGVHHNAKFEVAINCLIDGKHTVIRRGRGGTTVQQGGDPVGVREASFMDRIKLAVNFAFLSAEQAHFVDVQEHKRKEMLTSLIAEVGFLRNRCVPYSKMVLDKLADKKIKVGHDIDSLYILRDEVENALLTARSTAADEKQRIDKLMAQAEVDLPMSPDAYNQSLHTSAALAEEITQAQINIKKGNDWVQQAYKHNERVALAQAGVERTRTAISVAETDLRGVEERLQDAREALECPSCGGVMVCSACGRRIVSGEEKEQALLKRKGELEVDIAKNKEILAGVLEQLSGKMQAVAIADIEGVNERVRAFEVEVTTKTLQKQTVDSSINEYNVAYARSQELYKVADSKEQLSRLLKNVRTIQARLNDIDATAKRKSKTLDTIENQMGLMRQATTIMNEVMPSVYFNMFLSRLNDFCNFLLSQISTMRLELGANDEGITITVDGKEVKQLSSGERQRVRIATTLAFALMAPGTDTLFIDEVFDAGLDAEGVQALAMLLSTHMKSFFEKIIMISHQPDLSSAIGADRVIHITAEENGSVMRTSFTREVA